MRNILAIFAMLCIFASASFASGTYNSGAVSGTYNANIYCMPMLTGPPAAINLGNFFSNSTTAVSASPLIWKLTGDSHLTYSIAVNTGADWLQSGATKMSNSPYSSVLTGNWSYIAGDNEVDDVTTASTWRSDHAGSNSDDGSGGDLSCGVNGRPLQIIFTPTSLTTDGASGVTESFVFTVTVSVTI